MRITCDRAGRRVRDAAADADGDAPSGGGGSGGGGAAAAAARESELAALKEVAIGRGEAKLSCSGVSEMGAFSSSDLTGRAREVFAAAMRAAETKLVFQTQACQNLRLYTTLKH